MPTHLGRTRHAQAHCEAMMAASSTPGPSKRLILASSSSSGRRSSPLRSAARTSQHIGVHSSSRSRRSRAKPAS